jgi:predicted RNA binding protein YcfA (HicA-like mRNA interferase family)
MKSVSGKRMCRILEDHGWIHARTRGSHHIFKHPDSRHIVVVPVHGNQDLKPGTQRGIMNDADLSEDDLQ